MKIITQLLPVVIFLFSSACAFAQTDTSADEKPGLKAGLHYINNDVYLGRGDTITTPTLAPRLKYTFGSGLYFAGSLDYITNRKKNHVDDVNLEAGYNHSFTDDLEGGVSYVKLFYSGTSTQVSASISSICNVYVDYDIADIITPSVSAGYNIGKSGSGSDFLLNPDISHDFEFEGLLSDNDNLTVSPAFGLNFGSQNYYADYLAHKGTLKRKAVDAAVTDYYDKLGNFVLLDCELSAPVEYHTGHFIINFTPTYAIVQNTLPQSTTGEKLITKAIQISSPYRPNIFYFETGIAYKF